MRTIAIANQKGGSAKTTTAVNLAACLAEKGKRVLVCDMDPQASATSWLGTKDAGRAPLDLLSEGGSLADVLRETTVPRVGLIPGSKWLAKAERTLAGDAGAELVLRNLVASFDGVSWDYFLIDCPPAIGLLTYMALTAAGSILIPVEASAMAIAGLARLQETIEQIRTRLNPSLDVNGVLVCRVNDRRRITRDVVSGLKARYAEKVYATVIHENARLLEAYSRQSPITAYDGGKSRGAADYRALADEFLARNGGS